MAASSTSLLPVKDGKIVPNRVSFAKLHEPMAVPDLLGLQTASYGWLIGSEEWREAHPGEKSGLEEIFDEISPIENTARTMGLVLSNPHLEDEKAPVAECKDKDMTYSAALYVTAEFQNYETGEIKSQTTFIGDFPLMTPQGTFIINGTERVVVSQLVRSQASILSAFQIRLPISGFIPQRSFLPAVHGLNLRSISVTLWACVSTVSASSL